MTGALASSIILHGLVVISLAWYLPYNVQLAPRVIEVSLAMVHKAPAAAAPQPRTQLMNAITRPLPLKPRPPITPPARPKPIQLRKPAPVKVVTPKPVVEKVPPPAPQPVEKTPEQPETQQAVDTGSFVQSPAAAVQSGPTRMVVGTVDGATNEIITEKSVGDGREELKSTYIAKLRQQIDHYKTYPNMARRGQQQGVVLLEFVLNPDGSLARCEIEQSSGYPLLDRAALKAVASATPFEPLPDGLNNEALSCRLPLRFELTR
jgi:protein TonB